MGQAYKCNKNYTNKNEMPPVTFVVSLYKTHAVLCSKIADVHGIEVHNIRTRKNCLFSENFPIFITARMSSPVVLNLFSTTPPLSNCPFFQAPLNLNKL